MLPNTPRQNPEYEYQKSLKLTEEALSIYKGFLKSTLFTGEITFETMPKYSDFNYKVFFDGQFDHYLEVKVRYHWWGKYIQEKMPFRKFGVAYAMKNVYGSNAVYLLRTMNKVGVLNLFEEPSKIEEMFARHDRNEEKDLYALYDVTRFRIIDSKDVAQYKWESNE